VTPRVPNIVRNEPRLAKIQQTPKKTDGPKFADPSMAAVSPYFKESMVGLYLHNLGGAPVRPLLIRPWFRNQIGWSIYQILLQSLSIVNCGEVIGLSNNNK